MVLEVVACKHCGLAQQVKRYGTTPTGTQRYRCGVLLNQELDYNLAAFPDLLKAPAFTAYYEDLERENSLKRPPNATTKQTPPLAI
jgi:hypothetical protein